MTASALDDYHPKPDWWLVREGSFATDEHGRRVYDDTEWPLTGINTPAQLAAHLSRALRLLQDLSGYIDPNPQIGVECGRLAIRNALRWLERHDYEPFPDEPRSVSELADDRVESLLRKLIKWLEDVGERESAGGGPEQPAKLAENEESGTKAAAIKEQEEAPASVVIEGWADLAIGVDEDGSFLAVSPVPEFKTVFPKESAVQLPLKGKRWKELLKLLAASSDGRNAPKKDLLVKFGYLSKVIDEEHIEDVQHNDGRMNELKKANHSLTQAIGDLSRQLRTYVSACDDKKRKSPPLSAGESNVVRSAFTCQFLCRDVNGKLRFGAAE